MESPFRRGGWDMYGSSHWAAMCTTKTNKGESSEFKKDWRWVLEELVQPYLI